MKNKETKKAAKELPMYTCISCRKLVSRRKSLAITDNGERACRDHNRTRTFSKTILTQGIAKATREKANSMRRSIKYILRGYNPKYPSTAFTNYCLGKGLT